jgi:GNAT superfamily N-acetyltransferase
MEYLSTTALAKLMNMNRDYLFHQLEKKGLVVKITNRWNLTPAGEDAGGVLKKLKESDDKYIVWPDNIKDTFNPYESDNTQKNLNTTIRVATPHDIPRLIELGKELGDIHRELGDDEFWAPSSDIFEEHLSKDNSKILVAVEIERIVSYCLATITSQPPDFGSKFYGTINELLVTDSHRRQGIGEKMVHELEQWFHSKGISRIEVGVAANNDKAATFWQKMRYNPGLVLRHKEI